MQRHRNAPRPELLAEIEVSKAPGNLRLATWAVPTVGEVILGDLVPIAHNHRRLATGADSGIAFNVVDIAGVDVMQAGA